MKVIEYFTNDEKQQIEKAIKAVEKTTAGELVVMTVNSSSEYKTISYLLTFIASSLLSMLIMQIIPYILPESLLIGLIKKPFSLVDEFRYIFNFGVIYFFLLNVVLFIPLFALFNKYKKLLAFFIADNIKLSYVKERALKEFYTKGIYKTRDKTGVLILLSLLEKKVYILADKGIYEKISQDGLNSYSKEISLGIKKHTGKDALIDVITKIGKILTEHFPVRPDDTNELSDSILTEK